MDKVDNTKWNYSHKPTDDIVVAFDDKTGETRSIEEVEGMLIAMKSIANKYGFDINMIGNRLQVHRALKYLDDKQVRNNYNKVVGAQDYKEPYKPRKFGNGGTGRMV